MTAIATAVLGPTVRAALAAGGPAAVLGLAREARGPIVEPTGDPDRFEVSFVYADRRGPGRAGLFCPALPGGYLLLARLGAGLFAGTVTLPRAARVKYHFCPDPPEALDAEALFALAHSPTARRIDYLNPAVDQVRIRGLRLRMLESLLSLPGAPAAPPTAARPGVPAGRVEQFTIHSAALGRRKDVLVYLPPGYTECRGPWDVVLLLEGNEEWRATAFLDNLMATGRFAPFLAVLFADRGFTARLRDLANYAGHTRFVVDELWPLLAGRYAILDRPATVAGYSAGGLAAAALCLDEPDRFARLAVVSGALHLVPGTDFRRARPDTRLLERYAGAAVTPERVYLAAGQYEDAWEHTILEQTTELAAILRERGGAVRFDTGPTGHDTVSARAYLADALAWLLGG
ncbi:hypothetical protein F0L68_04385 [Solihabitans fulvus]|uniref:Enterochelin esterase n=1 Tax=Solihabitans fulvus TaxID=1892852 RepID=A0A5B2XSF7_9PSEU|nr:alpha/beta hydrolase-fold protein [Solihabitans fulvus]KAA2265801.1 hypothetical protein F0L68_04385 [Solihabitans fulvus]